MSRLFPSLNSYTKAPRPLRSSPTVLGAVTPSSSFTAVRTSSSFTALRASPSSSFSAQDAAAPQSGAAPPSNPSTRTAVGAATPPPPQTPPASPNHRVSALVNAELASSPAPIGEMEWGDTLTCSHSANSHVHKVTHTNISHAHAHARTNVQSHAHTHTCNTHTPATNTSTLITSRRDPPSSLFSCPRNGRLHG